MKFNERELAAWASVLVPDIEGMLEKKGTGIGQGYRLRWFRLKGNLLFYFKVDESGNWQNHGDPLGVIVLERVTVVKSVNDFKPYAFGLHFEGDDTRTFFLSAYSEAELSRWTKAIEMASYESLQSMLHTLQVRLKSLTGESTTPLLSPFENQVFIQSPNSGIAKKHFNWEQPKSSPQYELNLFCTSLPLNREGVAPNTIIRVRSYEKAEDAQALATVGHTEVIQSCVSPHFTHLILLDVGPICKPSSQLQFEVFSVNDCQMYCPIDLSCKFTLPRDSLSSVVLDGKRASDEIIELRKGLCIGKAMCPVSTITESSREMKLLLSSEAVVNGFLHLVSQRVDGHTSTGLTNSRGRSSQFGYLPSIMSHSIQRHFSFPATVKEKPVRLKVIEEMAESVFNVQVPLQLLKCYIKEDKRMLEELAGFGALEENWKDMILYNQQLLRDSIFINKRTIATLEDLGDTCGFKPSSRKKEANLDMLLCNLHIQRLRVLEDLNNSKQSESSYVTITSGCPADHVSGFRNGGLKKMLSECKIFPSCIHAWAEAAQSPLSHTRVRLAAIKAKIYDYNAKLYRACANAHPHNMNDSMIGISKQIQQFFSLMESDVVKKAIEMLNNARPTSYPVSFLTGSLGDLPSALLDDEKKRNSMKRKSVALPLTRCQCGLCSKCIPTPSDWVWNGSKFVQVSKEWKMSDSSDSIQDSLCSLIENVEAATEKVVERETLTIAPGFMLGNFKPTYVWSLDLIPMFVRLNQTLEGLFKVASSSLSFTMLFHDSHVTNFKVLRRRRDVVFSQVLTALVTSFYAVLSHNFCDAVFLKQLRELGFLVEFESLLSSLGDELGMLEDMSVAVAELATVQFQLAEVQGVDRREDVPYNFRICGTRDCLIVQLLFSHDILSGLVDKPLRQGEKIRVVPILFTQGINEKQTLSNIKHDWLLQVSLRLQEEVNNTSMRILDKYVKDCLQKMKKQSSESRATLIRDLHSRLQQSHSSQKSKNVEFLLMLGQLVSCLQGGRLITCKSGKDRTGMSVTLEECCHLRNYHNLDANAFSQTLSTIRSLGTRLENCLKNTGHRCYNFNQLQLMLLPKLLTPPPFTCHDPE